jgi:hypothetical protein
MSEGTGMKDGADAGGAAGMDAQGAAVIMWEARERAQRECGPWTRWRSVSRSC